MKRAIVLLFFISSPSWAAWTLIQSPTQTTQANPCVVTVSALGAGHLIVYQAESPDNTALTGVTAVGETFTNGNVFHNTPGGGTVDQWYTLSSVGGATTVSGAGPSSWCRVWEYAYTNGPVSLDDHQSATGTSSAGITPVLTGTSDVIVQSDCGVNVISGVSVYTHFNDLGNSVGTCDLENTSSTTPPTWTGGASGDSLNELAFKESAGSTAPPLKAIFSQGAKISIIGGKVTVK